MNRYVNLYTESNPNPNSLKFVVNFFLVPEGSSFDFPDEQSAQAAPLAEVLFHNFPYVRRVFITNNFVTVTKSEDVEWQEVIVDLKKFLKSYLEENRPILLPQAVFGKEEVPSEEDSEVVKKIKGLLDEYVKPAVESDGGAINFHSYHEGVVKVQLQGSCSGCPSSTITLKSGIENLLKRMVPEVKEVVAEGV